MKNLITIILIVFLQLQVFCQQLHYPPAKKISHIDNYHGTNVEDPYRWLEDLNSEETKEWIKAQNELTNSYFSNIPFREKIKKRLTDLWNYERYTNPIKIGEYYIYSKNDGLQEQNVYYIQKGINGTPEVLIDPNKLSEDGSISLSGIYFSKDNKYLSYGISRGGSDWREFYVMDLSTKKLLSDKILWSKFTGNAWYKNGFFYGRYDEPKKGEELKQSNQFQKVFYHKIGTSQSEDELVIEDRQHPKRLFEATVSDDEKYLIIYVAEGSSSYNLLWYKNLSNNSSIIKLIDQFEAEYNFIDNINDKFLVLTNYEAPNNKLVLIDLKNPEKENWKTLIPESKNVIQNVAHVGDKLIVTYLEDAHSKISIFNEEGNYLYDIKLPTIGTVYGFSGKNNDTETFYTFTSFTYPPTIYRYDVINNKSELFKKSKVNFESENYEVHQVFYESKDETKIPMFLIHKKDLELNGKNPALLYAYGGFKISQLPSFAIPRLSLLENGFVYALACIRGGGEYGETWHKAGMFEKKQNVFDDFISAAEWLIKNNYTSPQMLAIQGGSNGGLLVGAVINQRPDLFKVAFPMVGVMDMLRFHKFTIGWAWISEYGSSDNPEQFKYLIKYSPLHNIKNVEYPATLVTTADHDDRVFPAHSFKYIATLQEKNSGNNPALIRIETKVGHGAGTSTSKSIELYTDLWSFMFYNLGITPIY
ncbi:prolyl oligopeptidase family serine peptidase [Rosettibacter firmus]|uniref:prolyl oligopeptidase family serine peptidase n=1 Tax=Rosettibacter firmus TaxID=3111522 RepID=UPI00336BB977